MNTSADVSVVLPTYNEIDNIIPLVDELRTRLIKAGMRYQILVVDDTSPDGTAAATRAAFAGDCGVQVIVRSQDPGLAVSIRAGVEQCTGDVILIMDTDFNHEPRDGVLLAQIAGAVDLAIGSRFIFGGGMTSRIRYALSYMYNLFMRVVLGTRIDENLSGFIAIRRDRMEQLDYDKIFWGYGDYFFRLLLLSQRYRMRHVQVPVFYGQRKGGESKTRIWGIFLKYTAAVLWLAYMRVTGRW
jgi:dolichol-phosphate mannosyltransferase